MKRPIHHFASVLLLSIPLLLLLAVPAHAERGSIIERGQPAEPVAAEADTADDQEVTPSQSFIERIRQGKKVALFLIVLSVAALAFAIERLFHLRKGAIVPAGLSEQADRHWRAQEYDQIRQLCGRSPSTLGRVIATMVRHRKSKIAEISMMAGDLSSGEMKLQLQRAYPLAVVATISPLLGLLGTVFGMIKCFEDVAAMGSLGDAAVLADGISQALVTTAMGLVIAVPALGLYHYFRSRTHILALALDRELSELMSAWFLETEDDEPQETAEAKP